LKWEALTVNGYITLLQAILRHVFWSPAMQPDAVGRYPPLWLAVLGGAGGGLVWGIAARIWMRLISTSPAFSIGGTTAILIITTLFGTLTGLAFAARRRGWRRWRHYVPRGLAVAFFIPFGIAGGLPLMLTMLLAMLAVTQRAVVGVWVLAALAVVWGTGDGPRLVAVAVPAVAVALTLWAWLSPRWHRRHTVRLAGIWIERIVRTILLLLAAVGLWVVARDIVATKPAALAWLSILLYLILLYPLFLALRVGLEPIATAESREAPQAD
jgi:hypothetical protein